MLAPLLGALGAVLGWVTGRAKRKADVTQVVTETALDLLQPLRDQLSELRAEVKQWRERVGILERQEREAHQALTAHAAWDATLTMLASQAKLTIPTMPPLWASATYTPMRTRSTDREDTR